MRTALLLITPLIAAACAYAPPAEPAKEDTDARPMKFICEPYGESEWQWKLIGANGEPIGWSEGYTTKQSCLRAARLVKNSAGNARID